MHLCIHTLVLIMNIECIEKKKVNLTTGFYYVHWKTTKTHKNNKRCTHAFLKLFIQVEFMKCNYNYITYFKYL